MQRNLRLLLSCRSINGYCKSPIAAQKRLPDVKLGSYFWRFSYSVMPPKLAKRKSSEAKGTGEPAVKKAKKSSGGKSKAAEVPDWDNPASSPSVTPEAVTEDGEKWNWKLASWNVNGIRAWLQKDGLDYISAEDPDVFAVQETKCNKDIIPANAKVKGYHTYFASAEKEGYSGVGLYSKTEPIKVSYGIGHKEHDNEGRVITAEYEDFFFVTAYVPNSGRGLPRLGYRTEKWDPAFREYLQDLDSRKPVVLCGDLNVAHKELDLRNPGSNKKTAGFTVEERQQFTELLDSGFVDSFRQLHGDAKGAFTFWSYMGNSRTKNVGWRLDYFVISERLKKNLCESLVRSDVMGSDHCPITLLLKL